MTCTMLSVFTTVSCTRCVRHRSRYSVRVRYTVSPRCRSLMKILSRRNIVSRVWIVVLAILAALAMVVGLRLLQLGRARSIIPILSARAKVGDFQDDFFMFLGVF